MSAPTPSSAGFIPGRGASHNPPNRFERLEFVPDGDWLDDELAESGGLPRPRTQFYADASESLLVHHDSPDIGPGWGLNCYRGCEHGCAYCFARPYHEYLGWSSGLDFETKILAKTRAPELLRRELAAPRWKAETIMMSGATDCYQPAERHFQLTRRCLEVLAECRQPVAIVTKNHLVTRDRDLLAELARYRAVSVNLSITSLDPQLAGKLEPRASRPEFRLRAVRELSEAGVPVNVLVAPVIPGLNDHEIPRILEAVAEAGAKRASYILLRLPHAVKDIFDRWLETHAPGKRDRVLARLRETRGGKLYDAQFGRRMRGEGIFADQIERLFEVASRRAGLNREDLELSSENFRRPRGSQLDLFDSD